MFDDLLQIGIPDFQVTGIPATYLSLLSQVHLSLSLSVIAPASQVIATFMNQVCSIQGMTQQWPQDFKSVNASLQSGVMT